MRADVAANFNPDGDFRYVGIPTNKKVTEQKVQRIYIVPSPRNALHTALTLRAISSTPEPTAFSSCRRISAKA